jgi:alkyl sulfatase BDS1-like metallo-beta-lactamase superfamily hydrolase
MLWHAALLGLALRGAKVRDALKWVGYLDQAMQHAKASDVLIAQHHWPVWGSAPL